MIQLKTTDRAQEPALFEWRVEYQGGGHDPAL